MGTIGNLNANGNVRTTNYGYIGNYNATGNAAAQNYGAINNVNMTDNTFMFNAGAVNNATLFAGNGDNVTFNNAGFTNKIDADVFSPANTGFVNINNTGNINYINMFDNVPVPPPPTANRDLITLNNWGNVGGIDAGTAGAGQNNIFNWGNIGWLNASGNTNIWNG